MRDSQLAGHFYHMEGFCILNGFCILIYFSILNNKFWKEIISRNSFSVLFYLKAAIIFKKKGIFADECLIWFPKYF